MNPATNGSGWPGALDAWRERVRSLIGDVKQWSNERRWQVVEHDRVVKENGLPAYGVTDLHITLPEGEVHLEPVAMQVIGGWGGRVDLSAWPSLNRVRLVPDRRGGPGWTVLTDSNIAYPKAWGSDVFADLARELVAAP